MTHTYKFKTSYGMINSNGLAYVCTTPDQVIKLLLKGGSFADKEDMYQFNKDFPEIYIDSDKNFKNIKQDVIKEYTEGFEHWRKWCKFLDQKV